MWRRRIRRSRWGAGLVEGMERDVEVVVGVGVVAEIGFDVERSVWLVVWAVFFELDDGVRFETLPGSLSAC